MGGVRARPSPTVEHSPVAALVEGAGGWAHRELGADVGARGEQQVRHLGVSEAGRTDEGAASLLRRGARRISARGAGRAAAVALSARA